MLQCPKCGRTYETDTQKFCTHDGGRLASYDRASAPTSYDLNQTVRTDQFDPEETVTRMPDLGKTVASAPTSEIQAKETGPAAAPPPPTPQQPPHQPAPPSPQQPPPSPREMMPTVAFNQPPPASTPPPQQQQYYAPPQPQSPSHAQATSAPVTPPAIQEPYAAAQSQQYAPAPPQQYRHPSQSAQARKSGRTPLIVGLVVLVLLGGLAAWYFLIYKKGEAAAGGNTNTNANAGANTNANAGANTNANTTANANTSSTPVPPGANETQFINTSANLDGKLAENYSDFSFNYPNDWEKDPKAGVAGASNFVKVERRLPPDFTQENFAVSWYESTGTYESDEREAVFQKLVESWKSRLAKNFPEFQAMTDGPTTVNGIKGYELRFQSISRGTEKGDITLWGRVVFLPPGAEGKKNGTQLLMLTTSLAPELTKASDVGVYGELPVILNSFKMGSK